MFGKLPDLFDRNFAVGFFLPAGILVIGACLILNAFGRLPNWIDLANTETFLNAAVIAAIAWLVSIALLAINRPWVRTLEGYGARNPFKLLQKCADASFASKARRALLLQRKIEAARRQGKSEPKRPDGYAETLRKAADAYPDSGDWVLPTRFGNRYRAIEVYSRVIYGLDAIAAWGRLEAVIPEAFGARLAEEKAQLDFSVNTLLTGFLLVLLYGGLAIAARDIPSVWLLAGSIILGVFGYFAAHAALATYGQYVKSAFDLFRPQLAEQLGLDLPRSPDAERDMWTQVSRMIIYRSPQAYERLTRYRSKGGSSS